MKPGSVWQSAEELKRERKEKRVQGKAAGKSKPDTKKPTKEAPKKVDPKRKSEEKAEPVPKKSKKESEKEAKRKQVAASASDTKLQKIKMAEKDPAPVKNEDTKDTKKGEMVSKKESKKEGKKESVKGGKEESKKELKKEPKKEDKKKEDKKESRKEDKKESGKEKKKESRKEGRQEPKKDIKQEDKKDSKKEKKEKKRKDEDDSTKKRKPEAAGSGCTALAIAEKGMVEQNSKRQKPAEEDDGEVINSSTHRTEYARWCRLVENKKRLPAQLVAACGTEEGRKNLFRDYVKLGGDLKQLVVKHQQTLRESTASEVRWGFKGEKWILDTHGDRKGKKLIERKKKLNLNLGCSPASNPTAFFSPQSPVRLRTIPDPEMPDDPDEKLYFTLVGLDITNVSEYSKLTRMEMEGCIDEAGLQEFVKARAC